MRLVYKRARAHMVPCGVHSGASGAVTMIYLLHLLQSAPGGPATEVCTTKPEP